MVSAPDGGVYVGTQRGLYQADAQGAHLRRVEIEGRQLTASAWTMAWQGRRLWLGGVDGLWGLEQATDGRLRVVAREDGSRLGNQRLTALLPAPDGALWVGTWAGLARLDPATMTVSHGPQEAPGKVGVPAGYVSSLVRDDAGRLWVGIFGAGIRVLEWSAGLREPVVRRITIKEGLPHDGVNALVLDGRGEVWASTDDGIARVAPATLAVQPYGAAQGVGIRTYWTGAGTLAVDGHVLFGGSGGLTIIDPAQSVAPDYPVALAVTELRLGDAAPLHSYRPGADALPLVVEPGRRSLLVEFAALDFVAPQRRRYEYRLSGVDSNWIDADAGRRIAAYTNLPPGDHLLELRSAATGAAWSPVVRLPLHVAPQWHETWWARGALALAAAGLLAGAVRGRMALLRRRQRLLEALVAERTLQLQESQEQLKQIAYHDGLTGLANRRLFNDELRGHFAHLARRGSAFALLLIDLDHFKPVNDTMGHDAGDAVLVAVSRRLTEAMRETDRVVRLGGDEFAVLLPDLVDTASIEIVCARIRESVSAPIEHARSLLHVDASIGVARAPRDAATPDALYKAADLALYEAKAAGRGCWRLAEPAAVQAGADPIARSDALDSGSTDS
jgi:diguanylate cyclase (GGDEF)-like protein